MMAANCNQVPVSAGADAAMKSLSKDIKNDGLDEGSNHSLSKPSRRRSSSQSIQQQPTAAIPFPYKLHRILDDADAKGFNDIVSWVPSENGFKVHKTKQFDEDIMPKYFDKTKYKSFQRQLNMWGFDRVGSGPLKGSYLHQCFIRGQPHLCESMQRTKIKGINSKKLRKNKMNHDMLGGSNHSLGGGSNHSLGGTSHSRRTSVADVHASIEAAAQKVADLERQKEEIQRKLDMVSTKANAMSSPHSVRMITPQGSLHSRGHDQDSSSEDDCFQPLPLSGGDSLLFGGQNFFFDDGKTAEQPSNQQRRRAARRYSLEPKGLDSDEYVLKELPDFFGEEDDEMMMAPTPLPPNLNVVSATTENSNSSLLINLDKPSRRFSFLSTPVHNPFEKPFQIKQRPSSMADMNNNTSNMLNMKMADINNNMMNMNMSMMTNNMMNMNMNNNTNNHFNNMSNKRDSLYNLLKIQNQPAFSV